MKSADEMRAHLCAKATEDADFRARLLESPKATVQEELSVEIPEAFKIEVHEDGPTTAHLVLPPSANLTEADLQAAHGGWGTSSAAPSPAPNTVTAEQTASNTPDGLAGLLGG